LEGKMLSGLPLIEPAIVPDVFVSELHDVEAIGDNLYRFTFVTKQRSLTDKTDEAVVTLRVVMASGPILRAARKSLSAIGYRNVKLVVVG
jgi:hypothetical protein